MKDDKLEIVYYIMNNDCRKIREVRTQCYIWELILNPLTEKSDCFHRISGPAIERSDGFNFWYLDGTRFVDEDQYYRALNHIKNMDPALRLTDPRWWVREMK